MATQAAPAPIPIAQLLYNADSRQLGGKIGRQAFSMLAESGGGRGSTQASTWESSLRSHMATTREIKDRHGKTIRRGGTLPPGLYTCQYVQSHPKYHECVRLYRDPTAGTRIRSPFASAPIAHHRDDDFFIHGRGDLGSNGCIVPLVPAQRMLLTHAIRNFGGLVQLTVKGVGYMLPAERFDGLNA